ncbi:DNMT1, dcm [Ceraceosorus bombacis]|uniref:DNA (cytosine-5-)-methyltransferase n=1 Tax=Ceraceosorus bombacis TaxID=401625 RepID=A0A0P1BII6_9BASI|nr:DNMT1, dcm [Ceraceosorus bombacis]
MSTNDPSPASVTPLLSDLLRQCNVTKGYRVVNCKRAHRLQEKILQLIHVDRSESGPNFTHGSYLRKCQAGQSQVPEYVRVERIKRKGDGSMRIYGPILIGVESTPLYPLGPADALFVTPRTFSGSMDDFDAVVQGISCSHEFDETTTCFIRPEAKPASVEQAFHLHDFVYLRASGRDCDPSRADLLRVAQITELQGAQPSKVLLLDPHEDKSRPYLRAQGKSMRITSNRIRGRCWVQTVPSVAEADDKMGQHFDQDTFYVIGQTLPVCKECASSHERRHNVRRKLAKKPLAVLDLFSGAGGLGLGFAQSEIAECRWAIEQDVCAAKTFSAAHPGARVYAGDANDALIAVIAKQFHGVLPRPGEVDVILTGPPCQGFTLANCNHSDEDPRNLLVPVALSYIDIYRPRWAIIENVTGLVDKNNGTVGDVKQGMPRLVMSALVTLGYSVRLATISAASMGVPQSRTRVVVVAAKAGEVLPDLPLPSHTVAGSQSAREWSILSGLDDTVEFKVASRRRDDGQAPRRWVSAWEAVGDLERFDWENPHIVYPADKDDPEDSYRQRRLLKVPSFACNIVPASRTLGIGPVKSKYHSRPKSEHQLLARSWRRKKSDAGEEQVSQHRTVAPTLGDAERVANVDLKPGANHLSWRQFRPRLTPHYLRFSSEAFGNNNCYPSAYQRCDPEDIFSTTLTEISPSSLHGTVLHWNQYRTLSIREAARSQGFPDWLHFETGGDFANAAKQIGNAVPIPLASALGVALREAIIDRTVRHRPTEKKAPATNAAASPDAQPLDNIHHQGAAPSAAMAGGGGNETPTACFQVAEIPPFKQKRTAQRGF